MIAKFEKTWSNFAKIFSDNCWSLRKEVYTIKPGRIIISMYQKEKLFIFFFNLFIWLPRKHNTTMLNIKKKKIQFNHYLSYEICIKEVLNLFLLITEVISA